MIRIKYYLLMHLVNKCTEYAMLSLIHMAETRSLVSAIELSVSLQIPHPFLRGILRSLKEAGLVNSRRGQGGGFYLTKDPEEISMLDLLQIFQGSFHLTECAEGIPCHRESYCPLKPELSLVEKEIILKLQGISVQDLVKNKKNLQEKKESVC